MGAGHCSADGRSASAVASRAGDIYGDVDILGVDQGQFIIADTFSHEPGVGQFDIEETALSFYHGDQIGSLRAITGDETGDPPVPQVEGRVVYTAFGELVYSGSVGVPPAQGGVGTRYARRWSIEEMNQASRSHLGFEEPQGWTRRAVERTAPTAMLLYSLIVLWFARIGHRHYQAPHRPWYTTKRHPSFADMLATLRRMSVEQEASFLRLTERGSRKVIKTLLQTLPRAA